SHALRSIVVLSVFRFFFQAEDGIRDSSVTGVQTCALPIYLSFVRSFVNRSHRLNNQPPSRRMGRGFRRQLVTIPIGGATLVLGRSEERRVGKEWRSRRAREA